MIIEKHEDFDLSYFLRELKRTVDYDSIKNVHWLGAKILTALELHNMLIEEFKDDYRLLYYKEQNKLVDKIFKILRGGQ